MPANRFFVDAPLKEGQETQIEGNEFHHLVRVMRGRVGDTVELVNGKGSLAEARITSIEKKHAQATIARVTISEAPPPIILAIPLTITSKLDLIIEKGCELGASAFWIFPANYSEKTNLTPNQQNRLHLLLISAMKQCGRFDLPTLELKPPLNQWKPFEGLTLFGDTREDAPRLSKVLKTAPTLFITGPEKGFSPSEIATLENTLKAQGVTLHPNILRMETAPLVALTLFIASVHDKN